MVSCVCGGGGGSGGDDMMVMVVVVLVLVGSVAMLVCSNGVGRMTMVLVLVEQRWWIVEVMTFQAVV